MATNFRALLGPMDPPGGHELWSLFTQEMKRAIEDGPSGCAVSYRNRKQWGPGKYVTVSGPPEKLVEGLRDAEARLHHAAGRTIRSHCLQEPRRQHSNQRRNQRPHHRRHLLSCRLQACGTILSFCGGHLPRPWGT